MEAVDFSHFTFTYPGASEPTLSDIDLKIRRGEFVILAGATGSGKSTLLRTVIGLIPHMYQGTIIGSVRVFGLDVASSRISDIAKRVGYVFQNPDNQIFMFSVERDVAFGLENIGLPRDEIRKRVDWALEQLGIRHLAMKSPHELSDGQKQRVALAGVLAMKPDTIILDEPTARLDPATALELIGLLGELNRENNMTVLIVEHRLELLVKIATRMIVLQKGRIVVDGEPKDVLIRKETEDAGIGIPTSTKVHKLLLQLGIDLGETPLTPQEVVQELNTRL